MSDRPHNSHTFKDLLPTAKARGLILGEKSATNAFLAVLELVAPTTIYQIFCQKFTIKNHAIFIEQHFKLPILIAAETPVGESDGETRISLPRTIRLNLVIIITRGMQQHYTFNKLEIDPN